MNRNIQLTFNRSAELLGEVFPDENWVLFLSRNINGLTKEFATIPFDIKTSDISYQLGDIEKFAVEFGGEEISEYIVSYFDGFVAFLKLQVMASGNKSDLASRGFTGDFSLPSRVDSDINVHCNPSEISMFREFINDLISQSEKSTQELIAVANILSVQDSGASSSRSINDTKPDIPVNMVGHATEMGVATSTT